MKINRRDLLFASGLSLLAGTRASGQGAAPPRAQSAVEARAARLLEALQGNRLPLTMNDGPAGPGWDWLVQQARDARFTDDKLAVIVLTNLMPLDIGGITRGVAGFYVPALLPVCRYKGTATSACVPSRHREPSRRSVASR